MPFRSLERGWRRGATRSSYRGRDQAGATDVILDIKRLLLSPGNTSILPENIVGQSLSVGFRPLPQTTPICGTAGVALLVLTPNAALDPVGVAAGLAGAVSMAFGTVLTRKWQPPVPLLTFTAWQLAAGGLLLVPVALVFDPPIPMPTGTNVLGLAWLGLIGAGLTYFLWFRGISRLEPTVVSLLGFLSPGTAVLLGWLFLDQTLSALQIIGVLLVIGSIWLGQRSNRTPRARIACRKSP
ncbi:MULTISPECIES: DMT family transporter [Gammaproteobacteria]